MYYHNTPYTCHTTKFNHTDTIYARDAREAAECFAQALHNIYNEKFTTVDVTVKETNNDYSETLTFDVRVVVEPKFYATVTGGYSVTR